MVMEKTISVIPAIPKELLDRRNRPKKMRVAAYCRVSTEDEEQQSSYEAQITYYTDMINNNPKWKLAGIFADEGITGTSAKKRTEFKKLMELCKQGKVDMVLTKSISRFSRNTLDTIEYIRMLKDKNIPVIFEKENINTMEASSEMLLTVLGSFAQAESESISINVSWGRRESFRNGNVPFVYSKFLGYEKGEDGKPKVVPEEAEIVKRIFRSYLDGSSTTQIKDELERDGILSPSGKSIWRTACILSMLRNEKYKGDALLQKTYVKNFLNKKCVKNDGVLPQYYVSHNHEAIVPEDIFDRVQEELARRNSKRKSAMKIAKTENGKYSGKYALSDLLYCGNCGTQYRRVTWARNGKKRVVWRCISRLEYGTQYCKDSPTIEEERLQEAVMKAIQTIVQTKDELKATIRKSLNNAAGGASDEFDPYEAESRIRQLSDTMIGLVQASVDSDEGADSFEGQFKEISDEIKTLKDKLHIYEVKKTIEQNSDSKMKELFDLLENDKLTMDGYDESLVRQLVENIKVMSADRLQVTFKFGIDIEQAL
jgi:site-specific DNA recombinase